MDITDIRKKEIIEMLEDLHLQGIARENNIVIDGFRNKKRLKEIESKNFSRKIKQRLLKDSKTTEYLKKYIKSLFEHAILKISWINSNTTLEDVNEKLLERNENIILFEILYSNQMSLLDLFMDNRNSTVNEELIANEKVEKREIENRITSDDELVGKLRDTIRKLENEIKKKNMIIEEKKIKILDIQNELSNTSNIFDNYKKQTEKKTKNFLDEKKHIEIRYDEQINSLNNKVDEKIKLVRNKQTELDELKSKMIENSKKVKDSIIDISVIASKQICNYLENIFMDSCIGINEKEIGDLIWIYKQEFTVEEFENLYTKKLAENKRVQVISGFDELEENIQFMEALRWKIESNTSVILDLLV